MHYDDIKPIIDSISGTLEKIGEPLTENQKLIIGPALMIFLEKYEEHIIELCARSVPLAIKMKEKFDNGNH